MWQPIETAPRDGRKILGWSVADGVGIFYWGNGWSDMGSEATGQYGATPTHWRPLPAPPSEDVQPETSLAAGLLSLADAFEEAGDAEGVRRLKLLAKEGPRERPIAPWVASVDHFGHKPQAPPRRNPHGFEMSITRARDSTPGTPDE